MSRGVFILRKRWFLIDRKTHKTFQTLRETNNRMKIHSSLSHVDKGQYCKRSLKCGQALLASDTSDTTCAPTGSGLFFPPSCYEKEYTAAELACLCTSKKIKDSYLIAAILFTLGRRCISLQVVRSGGSIDF